MNDEDIRKLKNFIAFPKRIFNIRTMGEIVDNELFLYDDDMETLTYLIPDILLDDYVYALSREEVEDIYMILEIKGKSTLSNIRAKEKIIVKRYQPLEKGNSYVIEIDGSILFKKVVNIESEKVTLSSHDDEPIIVEKNTINVIGLIIATYGTL